MNEALFIYAIKAALWTLKPPSPHDHVLIRSTDTAKNRHALIVPPQTSTDS